MERNPVCSRPLDPRTVVAMVSEVEHAVSGTLKQRNGDRS